MASVGGTVHVELEPAAAAMRVVETYSPRSLDLTFRELELYNDAIKVLRKYLSTSTTIGDTRGKDRTPTEEEA